MSDPVVSAPSAVVEGVEQLRAQVCDARTLPLSSSVVLPRELVLAALDELRAAALADAARLAELSRDGEGALAAARAEAAEILDQALRERSDLLASDALVREAGEEADRILADARAQALAMRHEVDDYVDGKLANFEVTLTRTLAAVHRGRSTLAHRIEDAENQSWEGPEGGVSEAGAAAASYPPRLR